MHSASTRFDIRMSAQAASTALPQYRLNSELNRQCLPSAERDPNRKVAWMNAICLAVLGVGVFMTKEPAKMVFIPEVYETPQEIVLPAVTEPETPEETEILRPEDIPDMQDTAPQPSAVVVVAADASKVPFAVPVVGATLVSSDLRQVSAPPKLAVVPKPPQLNILRYSERGNYGDLPWPSARDYPQEAQARRETGDVIMVIEVGREGGAPREVIVEKGSGSEYLDAHARDWVRTRWKFNPSDAPKRFKFMFTYQLGI